MDGAGAEDVDEAGEATEEARDLDAAAGDVLAEVEDLDAVREHRGAGLAVGRAAARRPHRGGGGGPHRRGAPGGGLGEWTRAARRRRER